MMTPSQLIKEIQLPDHPGKELKAEMLETAQLLNLLYIASKKLVNDQCYAQDISSRCPLYAVCLAVAAFDK